MKTSLVSVLAIVSAALPTASLAVAPISDIFVRTPRPEWSDMHERASGFWDSHKSYHELMNRELEAFNARWSMKEKNSAFVEAKRDLLQSLQLQHRRMHSHLSPGVPFDGVQEGEQKEERPAKAVLSGRRAIFTPLPKRSRRLILRDYYQQLEYRSY